MNEKAVVIPVELETKSFEKEIEATERKLRVLENKYKAIEKSPSYSTRQRDLRNINLEYEKLNNKLVQLKANQDKINKKDLKDIQKQIGNISNGIEKTTKKVGKWALAVFGVRSAYMFIRNSINTIANDDKQLAADIDYMKKALAYSIEPLVKGIVNLAFQLLQYIRMMIKAIFNYDIFKNIDERMKNADKSAKSLKRTLASFDEVNILNSGSNGIFSNLKFGEGIQEPKWIKDLLPILSGIAGFVIAIKKGLGLIKGLGIGIAVAGIVRSVQKLIDYLKEPTFENFIGILEGISIAVLGIGIAFGGLPAAIGGAAALIVIELVKHYDEILKLFDNLLDYIRGPFREKLIFLFGPIGNILVIPFEHAIGTIKGLFQAFYGGIKKWIEGIMDIIQGDFVGGIKKAFSGLTEILLAPLNALKGGINEIIKGLNKINIQIPDWVPMVGGKSWGFNIPLIGENKKGKFTGGGAGTKFAKGGISYPRLAKGGIVNMPGRGIMYNGGNIAERGAEGILPLTDSQQMELLGATIGKYLSLNATIPVYVGNRQVAKEIRKINGQDDFAYNR